jgi:hypothetical protein
VVKSTPRPLYPRERDPVPKISPPPGFDPRTVHPVGSRYTTMLSRPTEPLQVRPTIGLCRWHHETLGYIFSTNNAKTYTTHIMYTATSVHVFPLPYQKWLYIPRLLHYIPGTEHRNQDAMSVIRVWQTRGLGRRLMETTWLQQNLPQRKEYTNEPKNVYSHDTLVFSSVPLKNN